MDFCLLDQDIFPDTSSWKQTVADVLAHLSTAFAEDNRRLDRSVITCQAHNAHVHIVCHVC